MMMQQTMETSHTDSIQVPSWTLGLQQVNPSHGHIKCFFILFFLNCLFLKQGFCFTGTKQAPFAKATQHNEKKKQTKKTIRETSSLKG